VRRRAAAALVAAIAATGCGDDQSAQPAAERPAASAAPVGVPNQGSIVQYADCDDWNKGSLERKQATVVALRSQLTPEGDPTAESSLADDRALEILDNACEPSYAGSLRLYKIYVRAQGFAPLG
jgi:hypothetical protein